MIGASEGHSLFSFHPYLGYYGTPGFYPWGVNSVQYNQFGLTNSNGHGYPSKRSSDSFVIGILGGSVAEIFADQSEDFLQKFADDVANFNRDIKIINLAVAGYKQPQQLIQLQNAILSGFEFDVVINIDGFNDLVLSVSNQNIGVNPLYPSFQHFSEMASLSSPPSLLKIKHLNSYYENLSREMFYLELLQDTFLFHSALAHLFEHQYSLFLKKSRREIADKLSSNSQYNKSLFCGPSINLNDKDYCVRLWKSSSLMINQICRINNIEYFHFLQPNQYIPGSKPLSDNEKKIAFNPSHPWGSIIAEKYQELRVAGNSLRDFGIKFSDFSFIFRDVFEDIYVDDCCHFGLRGNEILSEFVSQKIFEIYE